ncbi:unnamed protein product [Tetraodon nigroviridis]|uniref:(spotted green pufferfish) hypothetical protein n=1 Tax=Tetraodon nigroviridis TaxID=99883 RepID=Q4RQ29_TETNG|nr:unnamed protein product [Tetraodon nigroviridis]
MTSRADRLARQQQREQGFGSNTQAVKFSGQDYEALRKECLRSRSLFEDQCFPAGSRSLGYQELGPYSAKTRGVVWKRPKELCPDPKFIDGGATRTDICQGVLGDCWLLAAIASLTLDQRILARVVPPDQTFAEDYAGIFHFQITSAYETEAVTALKLVKGHAYSVTGAEEVCEGAQPGQPAQRFESKAYLSSVPFVFQVSYRGEQVQLIRVRNPWGQVEWTGAWSDGMSFSDFTRQFSQLEICNLTPDTLESDDVGHWNHYQYEGAWRVGSTAGGCLNYAATFTSNPQFLVHLEDVDDDPLDGEDGCTFLLGLMQKDGRQQKRLDRNLETIGFAIYKVSPNNVTFPFRFIKIIWEILSKTTQTVYFLVAGARRGMPCTLQTSGLVLQRLKHLLQNRESSCCRLLDDGIQQNLTPTYFFHPQLRGRGNVHLGPDVLLRQRAVAMSSAFINTREVCDRFTLPPGEYAIVPSTFQPHKNGSFILRVFSEKQAKTSPLEEDIGAQIEEETISESDIDPNFKRIFQRIAGNKDGSGKLGLMEFHLLWSKIQKYLVSRKSPLWTQILKSLAVDVNMLARVM